MAKYLVIVESPAKARAINKYLGPQYKVEASMGHIRDLPKSRLGVNVDHDFEPQYVIPTAKKKAVTKLKNAAKNKKMIYLAADPDREGEAICWHLNWILGKATKAEIKRVTFNEITPAAVREAFLHPRQINLDLFNSQQARRVLDRLVGYSLSPLLWKKVARGLSAGRVQSVALKLIVERERLIRAFVPVEYWSVHAELSSLREEQKEIVFKAKLEKIDGEKAELKKRSDIDGILDVLRSAHYRVSKIDERTKKRKPQPPFITSKLQQEAYNKLRFSSQKTMSIAQRLYEGIDIGPDGTVGLITYMRTDSVGVSKTAMNEVREYIEERFGKTYLNPKPRMYKSGKRAQEAHEAIRPTATARTPEALERYLSEDEMKLYDLIWKRFVSSQMSDAIDQVRTVEILADERYLFKTVVTLTVFDGFSTVYLVQEQKASLDEESEEKALRLPELSVGEDLAFIDLHADQHFTKPPARFNDASIVKTLEELGIGRPSTYAPTIQTIITRGYVERRQGALHPSEIGEIVIDLLVDNFPGLLDVKFTALMEESLDDVEEGKKEWTSVLKNFYGDFAIKLAEAQKKMENVKKHVIVTEHVCDICGKQMVVKWGRFGKFLACSAFPDCTYTKSISTGLRCPLEGCDGDIVRRQSRNKRSFYGCSNYPKCTYTTNKLPQEKKAAGATESGAEDTYTHP
jgi:DNA topoisomerase I